MKMVELEEIPDARDIDELAQFAKIPSYREWYEDYRDNWYGHMGFFAWLDCLGEWYREDNM